MYAIFEDGGRQYRVSTGDKVYVDLRDLPENSDSIEFDRVLMLGDGEDARIGQPIVTGAKVLGKVHSRVKGEKLISVKYRRRKHSRWKKGHRQQYLAVTIGEIVS